MATDTNRTSPAHRVQIPDRVFKTPMTFSPRLDGKLARPSPSRIELWREELGLTDESTGEVAEADLSDSNSDTEPNLQLNGVECLFSLVEYQTLQKELNERNIQRDELLFRIKSLTDKTKQYKLRLEKQEASKRQQIRILRKTHEALTQDKTQLIQSLEEVLEERETRLDEIQGHRGAGDYQLQDSDKSAVASFVQQIVKLQAEKNDLYTQLLNHENKEDVCHQEELVKLQAENEKLEQENLVLRQTASRIPSPKMGGTDAEKRLVKLELEMDSLHRELREKQRELACSSTELLLLKDEVRLLEDSREKASKENDKLKESLEGARSEVYTKSNQVSQAKHRFNEEIEALRKNITTLKSEKQDVTSKLLQAECKPPEVVMRIQKVESPECRQALEKAQEDLKHMTQQVANLQDQVTSWRERHQDVSSQLRQSDDKVALLHSMQEDNQQLQDQLSQLQTLNQKTETELTEQRDRIQERERQVEQYRVAEEKLQHQMAEEVEVLQEARKVEMEQLRQEFSAASGNQRQRLETIRLNLTDTQRALVELVREYKRLREICLSFPQTGRLLIRDLGSQVCSAISDISHHNQELVRKYRKEMRLRKKYHNKLVELKGNIRVFCRVRPYIKEDGTGAAAEEVVSYDPDDDEIINITHKGRPQTFDMDRVFTAKSTQEEVFNEVQALVISCIDGYNICIFAYGQTGSGKTYTMEGLPGKQGINQRALQELFRETKERSQEWKFTITVAVMEIYNENIRDLLNPDPSAKLDVKMNPDGGLHVPGCVILTVDDVDDVNKVFAVGQENRATATTNMNEHSSRSHALLCVTITGVNTTTSAKTTGRLNLVDLAGSERVSKSGAEGARLKEAQNINRSLSTLGDVIHALRNKQGHVPYRNSKLTYLLQDSLGGDSKTLMIVQVAPVEKNAGETVASLNFAQRVRSVELGQATRKVDTADTNGTEENGLKSLAKFNTALKGATKTARK